jgi:hypothetical protein
VALGDHTRRHRDAGWLLALLGSGFLVSWLATDVGHTPRSRYILVLAVVTAALTGGYLAPRTPPGWTTTGPGVVAAWIVALVVSVAMIVVHLGYRNYRNRRMLSAVAGCGLLTVSFLATGSVLAPVI